MIRIFVRQLNEICRFLMGNMYLENNAVIEWVINVSKKFKNQCSLTGGIVVDFRKYLIIDTLYFMWKIHQQHINSEPRMNRERIISLLRDYKENQPQDCQMQEKS